MTDANVMLGKIQPAYFPQVFGPQRRRAARRDEVVGAKFARARRRDRARRPATTRAPEEVAEGFIDIAVGNMANAIKKISVQRGYDVTRYTLHCFGGAGGQHACLVADALGMTRVFVHPLAGVLSAYGMGLADQSVMREQAVERRCAERAAGACASGSTRWRRGAEAELRRQGVARGAHAACTGACTCATRAPTRRWSCRSATLAEHASPRSRPPTASASPS